jgi:hypothetical protein
MIITDIRKPVRNSPEMDFNGALPFLPVTQSFCGPRDVTREKQVETRGGPIR